MNVEVSSTFWIGLDDTDEREHGCTTYDFNDLLNTLTKSDIQIDDTRLVRLWPFAPQRTRGNAALAASVQCEDAHLLERILGLWFESKYHGIVDNGQKHSAQPTLLMTRAQLPENLFWETGRKIFIEENSYFKPEIINHNDLTLSSKFCKSSVSLQKGTLCKFPPNPST